MVYKRFVKKGGRIFGPYYYESYREGDLIKKRYIGDEKDYQKWLNQKKDKNDSMFFLIVLLSVFTLLSLIYFNQDFLNSDIFENSIDSFSFVNNFLLNNLGGSLTGAVINEDNGLEGSIDNLDYGFKKIQYKAIINSPVKWVEEIDLNTKEMDIPIQARNVSFKENYNPSYFIEESDTYEKILLKADKEKILNNEFSGDVNKNIYLTMNIPEKVSFRFRNVFKRIVLGERTIYEQDLGIQDRDDVRVLDIQEVNKPSFLEYYTDAPVAQEKEMGRSKVIKISAPDELGYKDVLAYTEISDDLKIQNKSDLVILWLEDMSYIDFEVYDINNNGYLDYVEWNVPHLSEQNYQIIIRVKQVKHFNEEGVFVKDITEEVYEKDNLWSSTIKNNEFLEVSFTEPIGYFNDIIFYAKSNDSENVSINVYIHDTDIRVAEFNILEEGYYKSFVRNINSGEYYTDFDFKISSRGKGVDIDYIVDPPLISSVSISPLSPGVDSDLHAFVSASDSDGDDIVYQYQWYKDGSLDSTTFIDDSSLALYYPLDYDLYDYKNSVDGTAGGNVVLNTTAKVIGNGSYKFDGADDYISIGSVSSNSLLNFSETNLTISLWVYDLDDTTENEGYLTQYSSSSGNFDMGSGYYNNFRCQFWNASSSLLASSNYNLGSKTWNHLVCKFNGTQSCAYVNGALVSCSAVNTGFKALKGDDKPTTLGAVNSGAIYNDFNGNIDEVLIYRRDLSDSEISKIYYGGLSGGNKTSSLRTSSSEFWKVGVRAGDFSGWSSETNSSSVAISDPPIISSVSIQPSLPSSIDNLYAVVSASDSDGDDIVYQYQWYKDGSLDSTTFIDDSSLALYYPLDYDLYDYKNSVDGTAGGNVVLNTTAKVIGNGSYKFDGADDYISIGSVSSNSLLNFSETNLTISLWVYDLDDTTENEGYLTQYSGSSGNFDMGSGYYNNFRCQFWNASSSLLASSSYNLGSKTWNHLVCKFNGTQSCAYVNGALVSCSAVNTGFKALKGDDKPTTLGAVNSGAIYNDFNGNIDEVLIYRRDLSDSEISKIYYGGLYGGNFTPYEKTLLGESWKVGVRAGDFSSWSNQSNSSSVSIVRAPAITDCSSGCFYINNKSGGTVAIFDKLGNLDLYGMITESSIGSPDGDDLLIKNPSNIIVSWIDGLTGNLRLSGTLNQLSDSYCSAPSGSFTIKDSSDRCVSYIDDSGNMFVKKQVNQGADI